MNASRNANARFIERSPGSAWRRAAALWLIPLVLMQAGCGGGGGGESSDESPVTLGQPGPGDPDNYFPLAPGNFWHFRGTAVADGVTLPIDTSAQVSGTRLVDGVGALVLREAGHLPEGGSTEIESVVVKDLNGVAVLQTDDVALSPPLARYWELRFPLQAGAEFVQFDRTGLSLGEDLDGDGIAERVDVRSVVRVMGLETVSVPAGTFNQAAHVRRAITLQIRLSRDGQIIDGSETGNAWFARGVGWVKRTSTISSLGQSLTTNELLDAYFVDGVAGGMTEASGAASNGSVGSDGASLRFWRSLPPGATTVALTGLVGESDLAVLSNPCTAGSGARVGGAGARGLQLRRIRSAGDRSRDRRAGLALPAVAGAHGERELALE